MNHSEICHKFAAKDYGRNGGRAGHNVFCEQNTETLYSYGHHFPICTHLDPAKHRGYQLAFTTQSYSVSTSKHLGHARGATSHLETLYCAHPLDAAQGRHRGNLEDFTRRALEAAAVYRGRDTYADADRLRTINGNIACMAEYMRAFKLTKKWLKESHPEIAKNYRTLSAPGNNWKEKASKINAAIDKKAKEKQAAARAKREKEAAEALPIWLDGGRFTFALSALPCALRMGKGWQGETVVETSHGAKVPIEAARALWPIAKRAREKGRAFIPSKEIKIGSYTLTRIEEDGRAVIGCHRIPFEAMQSISAAVMSETIKATA